MSEAYIKETKLVTSAISAVVDYREVTTEQKYPLGTQFEGQVVRNLISETNLGPLVMTYVRANAAIPVDAAGNNDARVVGASMNKVVSLPAVTQDEVNDGPYLAEILEYTFGGDNILLGALMFEGYIKDGLAVDTIAEGDHFWVLSRGTILTKNTGTPLSPGDKLWFDADGKNKGVSPGQPVFGCVKNPGAANGTASAEVDFTAPPRYQ